MTFTANQKLIQVDRKPKYWVNEKTGEKRIRDKGRTRECYFVKIISQHYAMVVPEIGGTPRCVFLKKLRVP
jgi:hypothetical protein